MSENPVCRRADEHSIYFQAQVTSRGSGPSGLRLQRVGRVIYYRDDDTRDRGHHPNLPLEAHQHGHHWRNDASFGREQTHFVAGYLRRQRRRRR